MAEYLLQLTKNEITLNIDPLVISYLKLNEPKRKAYHIYVAGLTYSIYSDSIESQMYQQRKLMKLRSIDLLTKSH